MNFDLGSKAIVSPLGMAQFLAMFLLPVLEETSIEKTEFGKKGKYQHLSSFRSSAGGARENFSTSKSLAKTLSLTSCHILCGAFFALSFIPS